MGTHSIRSHRHARLRVAASLVLFTAACGGPSSNVETAPEEPPPTFTARRVLKAPGGIRVEIAEYGDGQALVRVTGANVPIAGVVFPAEVREEGIGRIRYATTWRGSPAAFVHRDGTGADVRWKLYTGSASSGPYDLTVDELAGERLDAAALYATHRQQVRDGTLERAQSVDRDAVREEAAELFARRLDAIERDCGARPEMRVRWEDVSDEDAANEHIAERCANVLQALGQLCEWAPGQRFVREHAQSVECAWGGELALEVEGDGILFRVDPEATNLHTWARDALLRHRDDAGESLADALVMAQTDVCRSPDEEHLVVVHPHRRGAPMGISYGTTESLYHSPQPEQMARGWFFDPREVVSGNDERWYGTDLRTYSRVEVDREADECTVRCGDREIPFTLLDPAAAREVLEDAETQPATFDREPYALARDTNGNYYYVDRGRSENTQRDFRVYRGRRGRMQRLDMQDVASDSEGEVFSTRRGDLRLLVDSEEAHWIAGSREVELRRVPIARNMRMIFLELGVYSGARLDVPCDDY